MSFSSAHRHLRFFRVLYNNYFMPSREHSSGSCPRMYLSNSSTLSKETYSPRCTCSSARSNFAKNSSLVIKVGTSFSNCTAVIYLE